jgi:hypothetical protein
VRTSKGRVLRLMREATLLAPTRLGHAHGPKAHDGTITTDVPDQMWTSGSKWTIFSGRVPVMQSQALLTIQGTMR